jgi:sugar lactone lactonase YvrE
MNSQTSPATAATFDLAEGVVWDDRAGLARWVDIREGRVLAGTLSGNEIEIVDDRHLGQTTGAVALAEDGGLLIAAAHGLATVSPNGQVSFGPDLSSVVAPEGRSPWRFNDGIVDPQGRFLVGTLALDESPTATEDESSGPCEVLLRISPDGQVETLRTGMGMSNGLGFSPDGKILYLIDTLTGTLSRHSYGGNDGDGLFDVNEPWVTVVDDFPSFADGMTVDAIGDLWVALWGGSRVSRYASDGRHIGDIAVNATQPTCAGFVGPSLNRLAITSARKGLTKVTDDSGSLFVGDVDAIGKLEYRWAGSTAVPYWI